MIIRGLQKIVAQNRETLVIGKELPGPREKYIHKFHIVKQNVDDMSANLSRSNK